MSIELIKTQNEYKLAGADLEKSKKEIADLKTEQEDLKRESESLKAGNEELSARNAELSENNSALESENKKLGEFNVTLTADNEKLATENTKLSEDNEKLEEHAKNLRDGLVAIREGSITLRAGEILSTGTIAGGQTPEDTGREINALIETASKNLAMRFGNDFDSSIWIYQPDLNETVDKISSGTGQFLLRVSAAGNLVSGEPVRANLETFANKKVYAKHEFIIRREYEVKSPDDAELVLKNFLTEVNHSAVDKGILPDPITGAIGAMEGSQLYQIVDVIGRAKGKIVLTAYARDDTTSQGPLRLNVRVEQKQAGRG